jgi:uncharacterized membrane protein YhaH (DUF805 family)
VTMAQALRSCLQVNYANFNGRARRSEYWYFQLAIGLALLVPYAVALVGIFSNTTVGRILGGVALVVTGLMWLAAVVPHYAVASRRLHDTGKSGWLQLISFVPFGGIVLLIFAATDSTPGPNQYGPNPKGVSGGYPQYPVVGGPQQYPAVGQPPLGQPQGQQQYGQPPYGQSS